jgi:hypothetical protein
MIAPIALFIALFTQAPDTTDAFVAAHPCTARWAWGEHAIGEAPQPWTILRCRVPQVAHPVEMRGTWVRHGADGWYRNDAPGVWTRIVGEP